MNIRQRLNTLQGYCITWNKQVNMKLIVSIVVILHISMHRPTFAYDHLGNQDENESIVDRFLTWVTKWINVCRLDSTDSITFRNVRMHKLTYMATRKSGWHVSHCFDEPHHVSWYSSSCKQGESLPVLIFVESTRRIVTSCCCALVTRRDVSWWICSVEHQYPRRFALFLKQKHVLKQSVFAYVLVGDSFQLFRDLHMCEEFDCFFSLLGFCILKGRTLTWHEYYRYISFIHK